MAKGDLNPLGRFSSRVGDYVRYRPSYPASLIDFLKEHAGLGPDSAVADVGSGTGIFTRLLLQAGAKVSAVEPNDEMRAAAEAEFFPNGRFTSVTGTAEATGLPAAGVSLVTCAQAFHWFDPMPTRHEFRRILVPAGRCALIWNTAVRRGEFAEGYEEIKAAFGTDFKEIRHENIKASERFAAFFGPGGWKRHVFENFQVLEWEGLRGRLMSSSYAPPLGHPGHEPMLAALRALFDRSQRSGSVRMEYETELYLGRFT
jgi:SAM-dependent methyltransferase